MTAESLVLEVARTVVEDHGYILSEKAQTVSLGRKPLDAWQATIDELGMHSVTAQQLFNESEHMLKTRSALLKLQQSRPRGSSNQNSFALEQLHHEVPKHHRTNWQAQVGACALNARCSTTAVTPA
jgi:hypothetical protein